MNINREIARLVQYGVQRGLLGEEDRVYAANRLVALLHITDYEPEQAPQEWLEKSGPGAGTHAGLGLRKRAGGE